LDNNQKKFFTKEKLFFLKTHNSLQEYLDIDLQNLLKPLGAIYIVRDPRNVITSMCNHYSMSFNEMYNKMIDENASLSIKNSDGDLSNFSFLGSWSNHYKSWKNNFEFKTLFIKYEDLEENAHEEFWKILTFIEELTGKNEPINKRNLRIQLIQRIFLVLNKKRNCMDLKKVLHLKR
jgi:hypothetical protein